MQPTLPIATDNIYKFSALFGLVLIVTAVFSYVAVYSASLDRKVLYSEAIIPLEAKTERTKAESDILALNKKLMDVTRSNETIASNAVSVVMGLGIALSLYGSAKWHSVIQKRDDQLAALQLRKLEAEVAKLESERNTVSEHAVTADPSR
jgi:hypothetical protein